jgi:uncharacterized protein with HEPN domain
MHADARKLLWDALQAADRAAHFAHGKTFDEYLADDLLRSGVERQLAIIGEALGQLRRVDPATAATISQLSRVVGLRNVLAHVYTSVDSRIVWGIVEADLAALRASPDALLAQP